jgi:Rps23 Pro-64 3,4-dihydroxylase Tpa1-like proline 4-hydroxylase
VGPKIYADRIYYYEKVLNSPSNIVDMLEQTDLELTDSDPITRWNIWETSEDGETYVFGNIKHTKANKLNTGSDSSIYIYNCLKSALEVAGKDYATKLNIEYVEPQPISISKYKTGSFMGCHVDDYEQNDTAPLMSAVLYLNDDYEGGELSFPDQKVLIKPLAGSIVVFPSVEPFYHQSMPVLSGTKYMVPAFWVKIR